jgi:hypothetical protein
MADMKQNLIKQLKLDSSAFSIGHLTDEPDDIAWWHARTPEERLKHMEILRRINYGNRATARLQRVLEITERKSISRLKDLSDLENLP